MSPGEVISRLALLGYVATAADEAHIDHLIDKVEQDIRNLCNISEVPEALRFVVIDMVCREFLFVKRASGNLEGFDVLGAVKSMRQGATNLSYAGPTDGNAVTFETLLELLGASKGQLVKFRRMF